MMAYAVFITVSLVSIAYISWRRRLIDVFTLSIPSALLYFSPAFLGETSIIHQTYPTLQINDTMYFSYIVFLLSLLVAAAVNDRLSVAAPAEVRTSRISQLSIWLWLVITSTICALIIIDGDAFFSGSKRLLKAMESPLPPLFKVASIITVTLLAMSGRVRDMVIPAAFCMVALLLGQRSPIVLAGMAALLLWGRKLGPVSLLRRFPVLTLLGPPIAIVTVSVAKPLYGALRAGDISIFFSRIESSLSEVIYRGSEFMRIQYQYAAITVSDFHTDGGHLLRAPLSILPFPRSAYTTGSGEFNQLYQPVLFPDVPGGMAYNPFAEFYAAGGLFGVVIFCFMYAIGIFLFAQALRRARWDYFVVTIAICSAILAFYIQRNSIANIFGLIRNVIWPMLGVVLFASLVDFGAKARKAKAC